MVDKIEGMNLWKNTNVMKITATDVNEVTNRMQFWEAARDLFVATAKHTTESINPNSISAIPNPIEKYENRIERNSKYIIGTAAISAVL